MPELDPTTLHVLKVGSGDGARVRLGVGDNVTVPVTFTPADELEWRESETKSLSESLSYIGGGRVLLRDAPGAAGLLDLVADLVADVVVFLVVDLAVDLLVDLLVDWLVDLVVNLRFDLRVVLPQGTPFAVF